MSIAAFFLGAEEKEMTRDEGCKIRCCECGWFLAKITSLEAEVELNCANGRCGATLVVAREKDQVTVRVTAKSKQA